MSRPTNSNLAKPDEAPAAADIDVDSNDEESILAFIKSCGQIPIQQSRVKSAASHILHLMQRHRHNVRIIRIGCHSLSNLAMDIQNCEILVDEGVVECVLAWMQHNLSDWRVCWLACSSLWNLARCKPSRDRIDVRGVDLIQEIIELHMHSPLVMQTSLGALSNLCIDTHIKKKIGHSNTIAQCFRIMQRHPFDAKVLTSSNGLLTNLAYDEEIAQQITALDGVRHIVESMKKHPLCNHLQRNASAALSNLSATFKFCSQLVVMDGVEALFAAIKQHSNDNDVNQLARGALGNLSIFGDTTSLHVAATYCDTLTVRQVILNKWHECMDVNVTDIYGDTPLHSAVRTVMAAQTNLDQNVASVNIGASNELADRLDVIQFLVAAGCDIYQQNNKQESVFSLVESIATDDGDEEEVTGNGVDARKAKVQNAVFVALHHGERHLKMVQRRFVQLMLQIRKDVPSEIAYILAQYCHPFELSVAFRVELEPSFKLAKHAKAAKAEKHRNGEEDEDDMNVHVCMKADHDHDIDDSFDFMDIDL